MLTAALTTRAAFAMTSVSRLWEIEVKGSMPKFLYTLQERRSLFAGKAAFGLLEILLVTLLETGAAVLLGIVHGYTEAFPTGQLVYLFVCTLAVDTMLFFGEFLLMLWVGNPLPALDRKSTRLNSSHR